MIVTALPDSITSLTFEAGPERTPGLHLSTIRDSILQDLDPKRYGKAARITRSEQPQAANEGEREGESDRGPLFGNYTEGGFTFEHALEQSFVRRQTGIIRPGELYMLPSGETCPEPVPGCVILTPDGISLADWVLEEFKFTWKSSRGAPEDPKFWGWVIQIKAYCLALETLRARLRAFFVNGDYTTKQPEYRVWQFEFTEEELFDNWRMLVSHARMKGWL